MLNYFRDKTQENHLEIVENVWNKKDDYIKWPIKNILLLPGVTRIKYHKYPDDVKKKLKEERISIDSRSNGPAVCAFLFAGGERPIRTTPSRSWSVHHIYDGQYPYPQHGKTIRAVTDGRYFTHSAGLVSVHPIADALADELPYFAWLLRYEAYLRFGFDPDNVFEK